jgi:YidC/Oxa1 family membrane protein insertase
MPTESDGGWLGITDKYWLVALVPPQSEHVAATFTYDQGKETTPDAGVFQSDFRGTSVTLAAGAVTEHSQRFFAGAKEMRTLSHYESADHISRFSDAIDFGWYWFFTKPFLYILDVFGETFGNFGLAIMAFTVILKLLTLPLSMKSYRSMARMRELQPQIKELQERFKDDKQQQGLETMALYKRNNVNPLSGCLPNIVQIPIFFALYKVLYVGIELRHAPFYGWIHDLSAPDPTSVFNLFGLIPDFSVDLVLFHLSVPHIGIWPLLMGASMFATQRLSPQPPDKTQAKMFMYLPLIFTFMMANVAAGLIIYWTWSNLIGLGQQWFIAHRHGKPAK